MSNVWKKARWWLALAALALGLTVLLVARRVPQASSATVQGFELAPAEGFLRAKPGRAFQFPQDFGAHPDYQTEWWYFTGNLADADGRRFGYQLTFFRRGLLPPQEVAARTSQWATAQVYLAHFTLSDVQAGQFHYFEQFARGAAGLAGAEVDPLLEVWLNQWSVRQVDGEHYQLIAEQGDVRLQLEMTDRKGPILQGIDGYSQKGSDPGSASYYFSQPRLASGGTVTIGGQSYAVSGASWMDHEFSTSVLSGDQVGWDWFALHLDDGSELMVYILRRANGSADAYSQGTFIRADGSTRRLEKGDFTITALSSWKSPHSGASYPARWRVEVPSEGIGLTIQPLLADQELRVSFTYWEGAVEITGTRQGQAVRGAGYVELTGYAHSMKGQF